jgi:hypothetical protein
MTKQSLFLLSSIFIILVNQWQYPGLAISREESAGAINNPSDQSCVIGQIQTRDKTIIIRSGSNGQLYTVKAKDGTLLADNLNIEELNAGFPELKEIVKNGLAGNDASLHMNNLVSIKVQVQDDMSK